MYDGLGRRRIRKEYTWTGTWTPTNEVHYVYDGRVVLQERDANNTPQVTYTRGNDLSGELQEAGGIGGLLARSDSSGHAFYHCDAQGNVIRMFNATGQTVARYTYDPFGNIQTMIGPLASVNLYRFSSKEYHQNSGLVYYLYRYYDPNLQRWINRDPIAEKGGNNLYTFLENDGLNLMEPFGLCWYKPSTWDWDLMGSGVEFKGALRPGLEATVKGPLGLGIHAGGGWGVGGFFNLGGNKRGASGAYTGGTFGLMAEGGKLQLGYVNKREVRIVTPYDPDKPQYHQDVSQRVPGWRWKGDGGKVKGEDYNPWKLGLEVNPFLLQGGLNIDLRQIWRGMNNDGC